MNVSAVSSGINQTGVDGNTSGQDLYGICQFSQSVNGSRVTTPSASIPWVLQYITAIAVFTFLLIVRIVLNCLNAGESKIEPTKKKSLAAAVRSVNWTWIRELCVFVLSMFLLVINFIIPYFFWWEDTKLNHGWCGLQTIEQVGWMGADCSVSFVLLLLWMCKVWKMWRTSRRILNEPKQSLILRFRAVFSRLFRDWECYANVANIPLIVLEVVVIACVNASCGSFPDRWKVRVTSLQFLRIFCLTWLCDKVLRLFPKMAVTTETVIRRIVWIACSFVSFAAWIQLIETLGDPFLSTYNGQKELTYWKAVTFLYGKLVFLDVTSAQLETTVAKISVYAAQAFALIFLVQIIPEMFKQLPGILRIRSFPRTYGKEDNEFVLILGSVSAKPVHRFVENFRLSHPEKDVVVMLEPDSPDTLTEQMHTVAGRHQGYLTVLSASVFKDEDMLNNSVISTKCGCAFFFANDKAHNSEDEDQCNFLRVHALKQCYPKIRVIVQVLLFENKERFCHIPRWRKHNEYNPDNGTLLMQADRVICTAEIQFALLGQHYFAPGISNIVTSWFDREKLQQEGETIRAITVLSAPSPDPDLTAVPSPVGNVFPGAGPQTSEGSDANVVSHQPQTASGQSVNESRNNGVPTSTHEAGPSTETGFGIELRHIRSSSASDEQPTSSADIARQNGSNDTDHEAKEDDCLLPRAVGETERDASSPSECLPANGTMGTAIRTENREEQQTRRETLVTMHPGCLTYEKAREAFEKCEKDALLFAVLQNSEFHIYPRNSLVLTAGAKLFFITSASSEELIKQVMAKERNRALAGVRLSTKMHQDRNTRMTKRGKVKIYPQLQSSKQNSRVVCDISGQYQRYLSAKPLDDKDKVKKLQHHVVVCVLSDRNPAPIGLINLIKPLRAIHLANRPPIVILARADFIDTELQTLAEFPDIHFVKGNPTHDSDLEAVNAQACRMCIIVDASERPKEQLEKWEQQLLSNAGYWPVLPRHFYRHVNAVVAAVSINKFLGNPKGAKANVPEEILICIHHKAVKLISWNKKTISTSRKPYITADTVTPSFTDALMLACYEDKDIFDLFRLLILGGYREGFRPGNDQSVHGCAYIGNQATALKMELDIDATTSQGSFLPLWAAKIASTATPAPCSSISGQNSMNRKPGAIKGFMIDASTDFWTLRSRAAASGYLVIGRERKPCQTAKRLTAYEYLVLERPFFVQERHKLIETIKTAMHPQPIRSLEHLPDFISLTIEKGRSDSDEFVMLHDRADWLYVYYGIVVSVGENPQNIGQNIRTVLSQYLAGNLDAEHQSALPRLPMAILTYVQGLDSNEKEDNVPGIDQVIPVGKFFHGSNVPDSPSVGRRIEWSELRNRDWNTLTYPDTEQP